MEARRTSLLSYLECANPWKSYVNPNLARSVGGEGSKLEQLSYPNIQRVEKRLQ